MFGAFLNRVCFSGTLDEGDEVGRLKTSAKMVASNATSFPLGTARQLQEQGRGGCWAIVYDIHTQIYGLAFESLRCACAAILSLSPFWGLRLAFLVLRVCTGFLDLGLPTRALAL